MKTSSYFVARFADGLTRVDSLPNIYQRQSDSGEAVTISPVLQICKTPRFGYYVARDSGKNLYRVSDYYESIAQARQALEALNRYPIERICAIS